MRAGDFEAEEWPVGKMQYWCCCLVVAGLCGMSATKTSRWCSSGEHNCGDGGRSRVCGQGGGC